MIDAFDTWQFSDVGWLEVCKQLQPSDGEVTAYVKAYLERRINVALSDERWFHKFDTKEDIHSAMEAIENIERFSQEMFGKRNPNEAISVKKRFDDSIEIFRDWAYDEEPYNKFGSDLLASLRNSHRIAMQALDNLKHTRIPTGRKKTGICATSRDIVLEAALQAYRRVHGKIPHAQSIERKPTKFDWYLKTLTDHYTESNDLPPYPWATIKGRANALRETVLPQSPLNYFCL